MVSGTGEIAPCGRGSLSELWIVAGGKVGDLPYFAAVVGSVENEAVVGGQVGNLPHLAQGEMGYGFQVVGLGEKVD